MTALAKQGSGQQQQALPSCPVGSLGVARTPVRRRALQQQHRLFQRDRSARLSASAITPPSFGSSCRAPPRPSHTRRLIETCLACDLRFGAAFRLVRGVAILEALLGVGRDEAGLELRRQFALFADAFEDRGTALLELAQVCRPLFQRAQLHIV